MASRRAQEKTLPLSAVNEQGKARRSRARIPRWMYRWMAPPAPPEHATFAERDRVRRGWLTSGMVLALGAILLLLLPIEFIDQMTSSVSARIGGGIVAAAVVSAWLLNRRGHVNAAGVLLSTSVFVSMTGTILLTPPNQLELVRWGGFGMLIGPELIAASLLPPVCVFIFAAAGIVFILGDVFFQPHSAAFGQVLQAHGFAIIARPVLLLAFVAFVAYLWIRGTLYAFQRIDRAEELAALERREAERTRELEEGVRAILAVHIALANGNFGVRVPPMRDALLWRLGNSLNMLLGRFERLAQADATLRLEQEAALRLAQIIRDQADGASGTPPHWPAPTALPLGVVLEALRDSSRAAARSRTSTAPRTASLSLPVVERADNQPERTIFTTRHLSLPSHPPVSSAPSHLSFPAAVSFQHTGTTNRLDARHASLSGWIADLTQPVPWEMEFSELPPLSGHPAPAEPQPQA